MKGSEVPPHMRREEFAPAPELTRLRTDAPVTKLQIVPGMTVWLVTGYQQARQILADHRRFTNGAVPADGSDPQAYQKRVSGGAFITTDPPYHTRLRSMLVPAFTANRIQRMRPRIEHIVHEHLDSLQDSGAPTDLVAEFTDPLPTTIMCDLLGTPYGPSAKFVRTMMTALDVAVTREEAYNARAEAYACMTQVVAELYSDPGDGLLSQLLDEHGDELSGEELIGLVSMLTLTGYDNPSGTLALAILALLRHPDQLRILRDTPEYAATAGDELLRYLSVLHAPTLRSARERVTIGDAVLEPGDPVIVSLPAANRDESMSRNPDVLDITRDGPPHLTFGHGIHRCLGAPLIRLELEIAVPALFRRFPDIRLAVPYDELIFRTTVPTYGLAGLPVTW